MTVTELLRRQDGVISREQAISAGITADAVDGRLANGRWRRLHPRVYLSADRELTDDARIRAAWLWAGPSAVLTGLAAAFWWGLVPSAPSLPRLAVGATGRRHCTPGIRVVRRGIASADRVVIRGLPTAGLALTAIEASIELGQPAGSRLLDRVLQRELSFGQLYGCYCRGIGRRGWVAATRLLAASADRAASAAERRLVSLLRAAGLVGWRANVEVALPSGRFVIDVAFVHERVAIEVDGWAWHTDPDRFRRDRRRQNALVLAGWTVLRFTWDDLTNRPARVVAEIQAALARAGAR